MTQQQAKRFEKHLRSPGDAVELKDADGDGQGRIRIPVSSTAQDRDGDQFSREGLENLKEQLESGTVPMMLDHGRGSDGGWYGTLGMIGRWDGGEIESRDGETVLVGEGALNPANSDAEKLREYIENDMPVGASVGFRVLEYEHDRESGAYTFDAVDLLETSLVGIPSNPMTVNDADAMEALAKAYAAGDVDGDTFASAFSALSGDQSPEQLLDAIDTDSADTPPGGTMTDSTDKDTPDDSTDDDLLERLVSLQEQVVEDVNETTKRLDDLEERFETRADDEDDDEDEDEEDDDKDSDPDDGDGKSVTIVAGDDADEETVKRIKAMREAANDDGELELDESKTALFAEADEDETKSGSTDPDTAERSQGWLK